MSVIGQDYVCSYSFFYALWSVVDARQEAEEAHKKWEATRDEDSKDAWKQALRNMYSTYERTKEQELEKHIDSIEKSHGEQQYG